MKGKFSFTYHTARATRYNLSGRIAITSPIKANSGKPEDAKPRVYVPSGYDSRAAEEKLATELQRLLLVSWSASRAGKSRFFFMAPENYRKGGEYHETEIRLDCVESGAQDSHYRQRYGGGTQGVVMM